MKPWPTMKPAPAHKVQTVISSCHPPESFYEKIFDAQWIFELYHNPPTRNTGNRACPTSQSWRVRSEVSTADRAQRRHILPDECSEVVLGLPVQWRDDRS